MSAPKEHRLPGHWILRFAQRVLDEHDVEHFVSPAVADLQHEWSAAGERATPEWRAIRWSARARMLVMLGVLGARARVRATVHTPWYPLLPVMLAVGCGVWSMKRGGVSDSVVALQWAWLALSVILAWAIATSPRRLVESMAVGGGCIAVAALGATALFGQSMDGACRWWSVGPLTIQVSNIALPLFVAGLAVAFARGSFLAAFALATGAQLALIAQPDGAVAIVFAAATMGVALGAGTIGPLRILGVGSALVLGALAALARDPELSTVLHVEDIFLLVAAAGLPAQICAFTSLVLVPAYPLSRWLRAPRKNATARAMAAGITVSFATSALLPIFGPYPGAAGRLWRLECGRLARGAGAPPGSRRRTHRSQRSHDVK